MLFTVVTMTVQLLCLRRLAYWHIKLACSYIVLLLQYSESHSLAEKIATSIDPIRLAACLSGIITRLTTLIIFRHEIQAWNLQSLLIKPVQRVLKYPLLLDKLVEFTEEDHPDRKAVLGARDAIAQMAQDINELKRRKDIGELILITSTSCVYGRLDKGLCQLT